MHSAVGDNRKRELGESQDEDHRQRSRRNGQENEVGKAVKPWKRRGKLTGGLQTPELVRPTSDPEKRKARKNGRSVWGGMHHADDGDE